MKVALKHILLHWILSGVLLGIAFVFPVFWPLSVVGGAYFIHLSGLKQSRKSLFFGSWLASTVKSLLAVSWFWTAYPIDWLPAAIGKFQILVIGSFWLLASLGFGLGGVVVAIAIRKLRRRSKSLWIRYAPIPFMWVIGEVVGSVVFSILFIGSGVFINTVSTFGYTGYLLAENDWLLQTAVFGGVYALSFVFVLLSLFLLLVTKTKSQCCIRLGVANILVLAVIITFFDFQKQMDLLPEDTEYYSVVTIDTNFPPHHLMDAEEAEKVAGELEKAIAMALEREPDYIILPKDARYFNQTEPASVVKSYFNFKHQSPQSIIVDSGRVEIEDEAVLQTFIFNGINKVEQVNDRHLVPHREYTPYLYQGLYWLTGQGDKVKEATRDISYVVGPNTNQADMAEAVPGVLFCSESVDPRGVRTIMKERPNIPFVAHPTSHVGFHDPLVLWHQLESMLKVQAVWNQTFIVSAGNHVDGKMITPDGEVDSLKTVTEGEMWRVKATKIPILDDLDE